jgi:hypothetical protein
MGAFDLNPKLFPICLICNELHIWDDEHLEGHRYNHPSVEDNLKLLEYRYEQSLK